MIGDITQTWICSSRIQIWIEDLIIMELLSSPESWRKWERARQGLRAHRYIFAKLLSTLSWGIKESLVLTIIVKEIIRTFRDFNLLFVPENWSLGGLGTPAIGAVSQIAFEIVKTCSSNSPDGKHALRNIFSTDVQHTVRFKDTAGALVEVIDQDTFSIEFLAAILAWVGPKIIT